MDVTFEDQSLLGPLFGQFDANLVQVENRLGVFIAARGGEVQIEGPEDSVARARDVLQNMYDRLATGQDLDAGAIEALIGMSNEPTLEGIVRGEPDKPPIMIRTRRKTQLRLRIENLLKEKILVAADQAVGLDGEVERGLAERRDPYQLADHLFAGAIRGKDETE